MSIDLGNALVLLGYGLTWAGARNFDGRRVPPLVVVFAPLIWLLACRMPVFADDVNLRVVVISAMLAMLAAATAEEFWRGRDEPLMSRWPTVIVLLAYAAVLLARIPATYFSPVLDDNSLMGGVSFALLAFGTLLFTVVMAFLLLNMTKERTELAHKIASLVDPLSGVANRRAFLCESSRLFAQQAVDHEPLAMLLFDLDRFKEINDRFGHAVGDQVLRTFAQSATATLGSDVLFGRIGGEEFASLMPVGDLGEAIAIADRVRRNFAEAALPFGDRDLAPTVSVGVTLGLDAKTEVEDLLVIADEALYRAKANGRNRVEATAPDGESAPTVAGAFDRADHRRKARQRRRVTCKALRRSRMFTVAVQFFAVSFAEKPRDPRNQPQRLRTKIARNTMEQCYGPMYVETLRSPPHAPPAANATFSLDISTLFVVATCVTALLGLFLLFAWVQDRVRALAWWGSAYLIGGFSVAIWSIEGLISPPLPAGFANALLFVSCGMIWNAARLFHGRRVLWGALAAGATVWLVACMFSGFPGMGGGAHRAELAHRGELHVPHLGRALARAAPAPCCGAGPRSSCRCCTARCSCVRSRSRACCRPTAAS